MMATLSAVATAERDIEATTTRARAVAKKHATRLARILER